MCPCVIFFCSEQLFRGREVATLKFKLEFDLLMGIMYNHTVQCGLIRITRRLQRADNARYGYMDTLLHISTERTDTARTARLWKLGISLN